MFEYCYYEAGDKVFFLIFSKNNLKKLIIFLIQLNNLNLTNFNLNFCWKHEFPVSGENFHDGKLPEFCFPIQIFW